MNYTEEQVDLLKQYEDLKMTIRDKEAELDAIKAQVQALIPEDGEVKGEYGKFYFTKRKTWKYSDEVETLQQQVKDRQAQEQATGDAEYTEALVLNYRLEQ